MAAHLEEQQELDNFKYFWKRTGRWIFALLIVAALGYLGYTIYQGQKASKDQEAAAVLAQMVEKAQQKTDPKAINADLAELQKNYPDSISTAQATLMVAATEFDAGRYDVAEGHLNWVLKIKTHRWFKLWQLSVWALSCCSRKNTMPPSMP